MASPEYAPIQSLLGTEVPLGRPVEQFAVSKCHGDSKLDRRSDSSESEWKARPAQFANTGNELLSQAQADREFSFFVKRK